MQLSRRPAAGLTTTAATLLSWLLAGCASPGAPRPPSLNLPEPVRDLSAMRSGGQVVLSFTLPSRTTDSLPLHTAALHASLCRQARPGAPCLPVPLPPAQATVAVPAAGSHPRTEWTDTLPTELATGAPHAIAYRLELRNDQGRSAGLSDPAFCAAGAAPAQVQDLTAQGIRSGTLLRWTATAGEPGEVLIERQALDAPRAAKGKRTASAVTWLQADPAHRTAGGTIDGSVEEGIRYRYTAIRRDKVQAGGRSLELRSAPSQAVEAVWHDVYPPATPEGLTAVGFTIPAADASATFAVDLIWQPVRDPRLLGYLVSRTPVGTAGDAAGAAQLLTPDPIPSPGFHDPDARAGVRYRYQVVAVDAKGNRSAPATAEVAAGVP